MEQEACPVCDALIPLDAHDAVKMKLARAPDGWCPFCHDPFPGAREGDDDE